MPLDPTERLRALLEDPRFPDGRSNCRLAAEIRVDCYSNALEQILLAMGARPFLMASANRRGWTLRPVHEPDDDPDGLTPEAEADFQAEQRGPTLGSPGWFAGRRIDS